jgi:NADH-quinone oxidoreductase subunit H
VFFDLFHYFLPETLAYVLAAGVHVVLLLVLALCVAAASNWFERKVSARMQDRLGPTRVGGRFGWLQTFADGIKLLTKEDLMPKGADALLFRLAPYISYAAAFTVYLALPVAGWTTVENGRVVQHGWVAVHLNTAAFFILAVAGLEVFGVILGGYASSSKWSLYGAMREGAQVVSYEVPLALCVVTALVAFGTMDLVEIGNRQAGWGWNWYLFHSPFLFVTFFVYLTCGVASVNRAPFDLAEAESELVAGFLTEYSGFRWTVFFMAEYASMFAVSGLAAILFLGGWNGPIPVASILGLTHDHGWFLGLLGTTLGMINFLGKAYLGVIVMMWLRWTLPRLRIDQVMTVCLKYCIPLAAAMFLGTMVWCYAFPNGVFNRLLARSAPERPAAFALENGGR